MVIQFETAKLAKKVGFDELSLFFYSNGLVKIKENNRRIKNSSLRGNNPEKYSAPTQAELQKWLREKFNINICLIPTYGGAKISGKQTGWLCYTPHEDEEFNNLPSVSVTDYTYKETLEKGLYEVLKLIENESKI